jgi:signal transduction histidine kinase
VWNAADVDQYALAHRLPIVLTARAVLCVLCLSLTFIDQPGTGQFVAAGALVVVAIAASLPWPARVASLVPVAEGVLAAAIIAGTDPLNEALLPYLVVPVLASGLASGARGAVVTAVMSGLVLALERSTSPDDIAVATDLASITQWVVVSMAVGLVAAWARRVQERPTDPDVAAYESAYRLLNQLRTVSRQLSVGLDPVTLADSMLDDLLESLPAERGAVFTLSDNNRVVPLTTRDVRPELWSPRSTGGSAWSRALRDGVGHAQDDGLGFARTDYFGAVIPVRVGQRTIALVGVERQHDRFHNSELSTATAWAADYAVRLDTALLFSEIRSIATTEERRRLAREIHDGVAQELASLGYAIDDLAARTSSPDVKRGLRELRTEVTRIITELRLSIFDLRSEVTAGVSLSAALSDYVRSLGPTIGAEVHFAMQESGSRLRFETEAELLRIAQEAITNCRRHSAAQNIWVSSTVSPPAFELTIADDGLGLGDGRTDSFGMDIMRERASRIGASLTVQPRTGGGTEVRVMSAIPATADT